MGPRWIAPLIIKESQAITLSPCYSKSQHTVAILANHACMDLVYSELRLIDSFHASFQEEERNNFRPTDMGSNTLFFRKLNLVVE